jgi:hypothetical protein
MNILFFLMVYTTEYSAGVRTLCFENGTLDPSATCVTAITYSSREWKERLISGIKQSKTDWRP